MSATTTAPPANRQAATRSKPASPLANLAKALAKSQQKCKPADRESVGQVGQSKYRYASAEEVIQTAREALDGSGLALVQTGTRLEWQEGRPVLYRRFTLLHDSGECLPLDEFAWPVLEEGKHRPLDKALGIADTSSLSYILRTLLLMPRVFSDGEMDARREARPETQTAATGAVQALTGPTLPESAVPPPALPAGPRCGESLLKEALELKRAIPVSDKAWVASLAERGVTQFEDLTSEQAQVALQKLRAKLEAKRAQPGADGLPANGTLAAGGAATTTFRE